MLTQCPSCGTTNLEGIDECAHCGADLSGIDLAPDRAHPEPSAMHLPLTALELTVVHPLPADATVGAAVQALIREKLDMVQIVENHQLVGIFSVRDLMIRVGCDYAAKLDRPVREFMTARIETLPPDAPITFAMNKMDVGGYRQIPVVQDGRMLGVASARDVIRYLVKSVHAEAGMPHNNPAPRLDPGPPGAFLT